MNKPNSIQIHFNVIINDELLPLLTQQISTYLTMGLVVSDMSFELHKVVHDDNTMYIMMHNGTHMPVDFSTDAAAIVERLLQSMRVRCSVNLDIR